MWFEAKTKLYNAIINEGNILLMSMPNRLAYDTTTSPLHVLGGFQSSNVI